MNRNNQKNILSCAVGVALSFGVAVTNAGRVSSWTLTDFDGDGLQSDFTFLNPPSGSSGNQFGAGDETCGGAPCADITFDAGPTGIDVFTTGFNFGGGGDVKLIILGTISASIDEVAAAAGNGHALQFRALDFGGIYLGVSTFSYVPDAMVNCTGAAPGLLGEGCGQGAINDSPVLNNPMGYNVEITDLTGGDYGIVLRYISTTYDPISSFNGKENNWRLEGIMHTVIPIPAAVWLFGSGLLGLVGIARRNKLPNKQIT